MDSAFAVTPKEPEKRLEGLQALFSLLTVGPEALSGFLNYNGLCDQSNLDTSLHCRRKSPLLQSKLDVLFCHTASKQGELQNSREQTHVR